jgi:short-subunit dehydrogenase involved in D-alanine esterification of teichoic acids
LSHNFWLKQGIPLQSGKVKEDMNMGVDFSLKGQVAIITGASRGIGEAIARAFASEGARVAITGRSAAELATLQREFTGLGVRCESIVADLNQSGAVEQVWKQATQAFGHIEIFVNNAGKIMTFTNSSGVASSICAAWTTPKQIAIANRPISHWTKKKKKEPAQSGEKA